MLANCPSNRTTPKFSLHKLAAILFFWTQTLVLQSHAQDSTQIPDAYNVDPWRANSPVQYHHIDTPISPSDYTNAAILASRLIGHSVFVEQQTHYGPPSLPPASFLQNAEPLNSYPTASPYITESLGSSVASQQPPTAGPFSSEDAVDRWFDAVDECDRVDPLEHLRRGGTFWQRLSRDQARFYQADTMLQLAGFVGVGAVIANTSTDENLRDIAHDNIINTATDEWAESLHANKEFGNGAYTLPVFGAAIALRELMPDCDAAVVAGNWGEDAVRTFAVGAIPLVVLQRATGGARPGEMDYDSNWRPFENGHGVSGHAFMGAIPFLAAANQTDNRWAKGGFYAASTLTGLSRWSDDDHYFSQILMGWGIAFISSRVVDKVNDESRPAESNYRMRMLSPEIGQGFALEKTW